MGICSLGYLQYNVVHVYLGIPVRSSDEVVDGGAKMTVISALLIRDTKIYSWYPHISMKNVCTTESKWQQNIIFRIYLTIRHIQSLLCSLLTNYTPTPTHMGMAQQCLASVAVGEFKPHQQTPFVMPRDLSQFIFSLGTECIQAQESGRALYSMCDRHAEWGWLGVI